MQDKVIPFDFNNTQIASFYDEVSVWSAHFGQLMLQHLKPKHNLTILDLACGTGYPLFQLAYLYGASCKVIGLDIWSTALKRAEQRRQYFGLEHLELVKYNGTTYPFPDNHFDLITSNVGVNNFDDPASALAECHRVLKPNGHIAITTNTIGHMQAFYTVFHDILKAHGNNEYIERLIQHENHRGTIASHRALLENAGFSIITETSDSFTWRFLDGTTLFNHPVIRMGFLPAWLSVINKEAAIQPIFNAIEKQLNQIASDNGELSLTIPILYLEGMK